MNLPTYYCCHIITFCFVFKRLLFKTTQGDYRVIDEALLAETT